MNETSQTTRSGANGSSVSDPRVRPLEDGDARVGAQARMELPVADVDRDDARRAGLEQAVGEAAGRGADIGAVAPFDVDAERVECVAQLLSATGDERRWPLDAELGVLVDLLPGLLVAGHEPGEHERLRLASALRQALFHEEDVESLACAFQRRLARELVAPGGEQMPTWRLVLIIVLVVLALFGASGTRGR